MFPGYFLETVSENESYIKVRGTRNGCDLVNKFNRGVDRVNRLRRDK